MRREVMKPSSLVVVEAASGATAPSTAQMSAEGTIVPNRTCLGRDGRAFLCG